MERPPSYIEDQYEVGMGRRLYNGHRRKIKKTERNIEIGAGVATLVGLGIFYYYLYRIGQV